MRHREKITGTKQMSTKIHCIGMCESLNNANTDLNGTFKFVFALLRGTCFTFLIQCTH